MAADRNRVSRGTASGNRISVYRNNTSYVEGNAVRKANSALPEKKRRQQVAPQTEVKPARRKERAPRLTGKSALLFGVCAVITFGSIANYLQLKDKVSVKTAEISNVTMQTESVKAQNDAIYYTVNAYKDTANIVEQAKQLGMIQAGKDQTRFYQSSQSEYMKQYKDIPTE